MSPRKSSFFERPVPDRSGPNRQAANFYRSASTDGSAVGGVPLDSVEAAVTSAVRMGYKIAESQIDRTTRLAQRFRAAGDRVAGPESDRQALDATEQFVFKALMAGLSWFEGVAADRSNPIKRLAAAEFRLLGSMLGLTPDEPSRSSGSPPEPATQQSAGRFTEPVRVRDDAYHGRPRTLKIKHAAKERRPVHVLRFELAGATAGGRYELTFYGAEPTRGTMKGEILVTSKGSPVLTLNATSPGGWKAAICDADGFQLGFIEIAL